MDNLKPMPDHEKFNRAFEMVDLYQKYVPTFIEARLGYGEMYNLRSIWQAAIAPIHIEASSLEKYTQAYSNWLWVAHCSHNALADQLSTQEVLEYKRMLLDLYSKILDNTMLAVLRLLYKHAALAKALVYELQWITPVELISCNHRETTCVVNICKVRQTPGTDRICRVDCRNIGSTIARQVYDTRRETVLTELGCEIKLTPLDHKKD